MRLMLGTTQGTPALLVETQSHDRQHFNFWVVNGDWKGSYNNGFITVYCPFGDYTSLVKDEILCDNQDRLRGNYQDVFNNFVSVAYAEAVKKHFGVEQQEKVVPKQKCSVCDTTENVRWVGGSIPYLCDSPDCIPF